MRTRTLREAWPQRRSPADADRPGRWVCPSQRSIECLTLEDDLGAGFIMEWLDGEALGSRILKSPELEDIRPRLARECGQILARIHGIDPAESGLTQMLSTVTTEAFIRKMWEQYQSYRYTSADDRLHGSLAACAYPPRRRAPTRTQ